MAASNTRECFSECIGRKVVGVLFNALPTGWQDIANGTKTLVFDDGRGLTISSTGTFWQESADDINQAVRVQRAELEARKRELADVLALAGCLDGQEG